MAMMIVSIISLILIVSCSFLFYFVGRKNGVLQSRNYYNNFYKQKYDDEYRNKVDPKSLSYRTGLHDGILQRDMERVKTLMSASSEPATLTDADIKLLANGGVSE